MTPDDYEIPDEPYDFLGELEKFKAQNDTLIRQAGDMENVIHRQAERIRDLEARAAFWKRIAKRYWKDHKAVVAQIRPWFDRTNEAEAEVERLRHMLPPPQSPDGGWTVSGSSNTNPKQRTVLHRDR